MSTVELLYMSASLCISSSRNLHSTRFSSPPFPATLLCSLSISLYTSLFSLSHLFQNITHSSSFFLFRHTHNTGVDLGGRQLKSIESPYFDYIATFNSINSGTKFNKDSCEMVDQMATEQYLQEASNLGDCSENKGTSQQKCKSGSNTDDKAEQGITGCFDCNICLDFVHDPVVTLCGHLYCWPCIYKWIHYQSVSAENLDSQQPQCPVCKTVVSMETIVPLYGRGLSTKPSESKASHLGLVIPQRPSTTRCENHTRTPTPTMRPAQQVHYRQHRQQAQPFYSFPDSYSATPMLSLSSTTASNPVVGVFGEMVYARLFGNSETTFYNPNSYNIIINSNPRFRRHVMEADKSLGRLLFFLCCCTVLCLLLF